MNRACLFFVLGALFFAQAFTFASTNVCGTYSTNVNWTAAGSPYIATCSVTISASAVLTIDAGVTVQFASGTQLDVFGKLTAVGTQSSPILFTSSAGTPTPGSWRQVIFKSGSSAASRISYATLSYGGSINGTIVLVDGVSISLDHLTISNSSTAGVLVINGGTLTLSDSTITSNATYGVNLQTSGGINVTNTTISNNGDYAISAGPGNRVMGMTAVTVTGNGGGSKNAVGYRGGTISCCTETWTIGIDWVVVGYLAVDVNATLVIPSGAVVKLASGTELDVFGKLTAIGTQSSPILFTSSAGTPTPGSWRQVIFKPGSSAASRISYATLSYGGSINGTIVLVDGVSISLDHLTISNSSTAGVLVINGGTLTLSDSTITSNATYGVNLQTSGGITVTNTTISNNSDYAISAGPGNRVMGMTAVTVTGNGGGTKNSVGYRAGTISWAQNWTAGIDWVVTGITTIDANGNLTIPSGSIIKFAPDTGLYVYGRLTAVGVQSTPIIFTSNATIPAPGNWRGIRFLSGSNAGNRLAYANLLYAGAVEGSSLNRYVLANSRPFVHFQLFERCYKSQFDIQSDNQRMYHGLKRKRAG